MIPQFISESLKSGVDYIKSFKPNQISKKILEITNINEYIEIIESFKKYKYSEYITLVNQKLIEALHSPQFNPLIAPYFKTINSVGEPFTHFEMEPDSISQIKKIINALYHARLAFLDLEHIDIRNNTASGMGVIYEKTIHEAYQACYLLTHADIDINNLFTEVLNYLAPLLNHFQSIAATKLNNPETLAQLKNWPSTLSQLPPKLLDDWPLKAGKVAGNFIKHVHSESSDLDFDVLTQFSAELPSYLEKLSQYLWDYGTAAIPDRIARSLSQYSSMIKANMDQNKKAELEKEAFKLKDELEHLKNKGPFTMTWLRYIRIIRNIVNLSTSSLEQLNNLLEESQDVIRELLARLKYVELPNLLSLVDSIEADALLNPGTLSVPLMKQVRSLYNKLILIVSKTVDFEEKGEELLDIEDSSFLRLRLEGTYKKMDKAKLALTRIETVEQAFQDFYQILENPELKQVECAKLPQILKNQLIESYKILKPYMKHINPKLNSLIISQLLKEEEPPNKPFKQRVMQWLKKPDLLCLRLLEQKQALEQFLAKKRVTYSFQIELAQDLIYSIQEKTHLTLLRHQENSSVALIDESSVFSTAVKNASPNLSFTEEQGNQLVADPEQLTANQSFELAQYYENKRTKLALAKEAFESLCQLLNEAPLTQGEALQPQFDPALKVQCRNLYQRVQPYFINSFPSQLKKTVLKFDRYLVKTCSAIKVAPQTPITNLFKKNQKQVLDYFKSLDAHWSNKNLVYTALAKNKLKEEQKVSLLCNEAHTPKTFFSKYIELFRQTVFEVKALLNPALQKELAASESGIPFPELQDYNQSLTQGKQTLALKKIFNALFHLEEMVKTLEHLGDHQCDSSYQLYQAYKESAYISQVYQAYTHLYKITNLITELSKDPHFSLIAQELTEKTAAIFNTLKQESLAYQINIDEVEPSEQLEYYGLCTTFNAFFIIPKQLNSLIHNQPLTEEELNKLNIEAKKATLKIEKIIENSGSYFRLFLQIPTMYSLYKNLTHKIKDFVSTIHNTAMDNLDQFRSICITPMLLEADLWEHKLGLKPGLFSKPLKEITDHFFKGVLDALDLDSKHYFELFCDPEPMNKRIEAAKNLMNQARQQMSLLDNKYQDIEYFYRFIEQAPQNKANPDFTQELLIYHYQKALPKLLKLEKKLTLPDRPQAEDLLNLLVNPEIPKEQYALRQLTELIKTCHHYYLGKKASAKISLENATEQLTYLTQTQQQQNDAQFIQDYTTQAFEQQMEIYLNYPNGLQYSTQQCYSEKLTHYLQEFKEQIINEAKSSDNIQKSMKELLQKQIGLFEEQHFVTYFQLDTVKIALTQFINYFAKQNAFFENKKTLAKKTKQINELMKIAEKEYELIDGQMKPISIKTRLEQIKTIVKSYQFKKIILDTRKESHLSIRYLIHCFFNLLEALGLYNSPHKKLYRHLEKIIDKEPEIGQLSRRFDLFSRNTVAKIKTKNLNRESLAEKWNNTGRNDKHRFLQEVNKKKQEQEDEDLDPLYEPASFSP